MRNQLHKIFRIITGFIPLIFGMVIGPILVFAQDGIINQDSSVCRYAVVQLHAKPALQYSWYPSSLFNNPTLQEPVITADSSRKYYLDRKLVDNNLISNNNFEEGNTGFFTTYNYCSTGNCLAPFPGNGYAITTDASIVHSGFSGKDHSSGSGQFMVINGAKPGLVLWRQTIPVSPNTNYAFGTWLTTLNARNPAGIRFSINGITAGADYIAPPVTGKWAQYFVEWNSTSNSVAILEIQISLPVSDGNDFGLDDIFFGQLHTETDSVSISVNDYAPIFLNDTIGICKDSVEIDAGAGFQRYLWNTGATTRRIVVDQPGSVIVKVATSEGCENTDTIIVKHTLQITTRPLTGCGDELVLLNNGVVEDVRGKVIEFFSDSSRTNQLNSSVKISTRPSNQGPFYSPEEYRNYIEKLNEALPPQGFGETYLPQYSMVSNNIIFNGPTQDIAYKYTIRFFAMTEGIYKFRTSFDFGRGGAIFLDNIPVAFNPGDMWWNLNWDTPGQTLQWSTTLKPGIHEIIIYGLENCCDGPGSAEFLAPGESGFHPFSTLAYVEDSGTYYVSVHDPVTGCTSKDSIQVTRSPRPTLSVTDPFPVCKPATIDLTAAYITAGTDSPLNLKYYKDPSLSDPVIDPMQIKDSGSYYIVGQAANNCYSETKEVLVKIYSVPNVYFTGSQDTACTGQLILFTNRSPVVPGYSFHWNFGTTLSGDTSIAENPNFAYPIPGSYRVTLQVAGNGGCAGNYTDTIRISQKPGNGIKGPTQVCAGDQVKFERLGPSPLTNSLLWNFGNGQQSNEEFPAPQKYSSGGTYIAELIEKNEGCADTATHSLLVLKEPEIGLKGQEISICAGASEMLIASGGIYYTWSPATGLSDQTIAQPIAKPDNDTWYFVQVTDSAGCTGRDSIRMIVHKPVQLSTRENYAVCKGEQIQFNVIGAVNYQWLADETLSSLGIPDPLVRPVGTRTYSVIGYGPGDCFSDTASISVIVYDLPVVIAGNDTTISAGNSIQLNLFTSPDVSSFKWTPPAGLSCTDCAMPIALPQNSTKYSIMVANAAGCKASDEITINLKCSLENVHIPNVFTPNNDGKNDVFYPLGSGISKVNYLRIFNRWGTLVFERKDFRINEKSAGWDGRVNGQSAPGQVFVYDIQMVCDNGQLINLKNNVSLIR